MTRRYRVAYLVSHPIQYQAPLLRYLSKDPQIDLTVFFMSDLSVVPYRDQGFGVTVVWDVPLTDGYSHSFLRALGRTDRLSSVRPMVYLPIDSFRAKRFDALWLHGYSHQASLRAVWAAKRYGIKVLLRGESHLNSHVRSPSKARLKGILMPRFFAQIDAFLAIGSLNRRYYEHYGVPKHRIFDMPYAVDNDFFRTLTKAASMHRESLRAELNFQPGRPVVLYASKFQSRKRPDLLFDAYKRLSPDGSKEPTPYLLLIGDGEERRALEERYHRTRWTSVRFLGFKNQTELPQYYDLCDVFVLPSEFEPWGLVVNEVMNAGKPIILSDEVGAAADLVKHGDNGLIFPRGDSSALADQLQTLVSDPSRCREMGQRSLSRITSWNFESDREGILRALEYVSKPDMIRN
jgi:glycosyltransferase involved in cell wall biosynthesis